MWRKQAEMVENGNIQSERTKQKQSRQNDGKRNIFIILKTGQNRKSDGQRAECAVWNRNI